MAFPFIGTFFPTEKSHERFIEGIKEISGLVKKEAQISGLEIKGAEEVKPTPIAPQGAERVEK